MTFALMLWLWWPFREENILASQTQVVSLNNDLQLLYVHCVLYVWNWIGGRIMKIFMLPWCKPWPRHKPGKYECFSFKWNSGPTNFLILLNYILRHSNSFLFSGWIHWWSQMLYCLIERLNSLYSCTRETLDHHIAIFFFYDSFVKSNVIVRI